MAPETKISLVISTLGRREPLVRCLETIRQQTHPPTQIIVVDQNEPEWLAPCLVPFRPPHLPLLVVGSPRGAAIGRNYGSVHVTGEILGFPDDDCWYPPELLADVAGWFTQHPEIALLSTRILDGTGQPVLQPWPQEAIALTPSSIWRSCPLAGLFVRTAAFRAVGGFDPDLGVGAASGMEGCEETDLGLRLLAAGYAGTFEPKLAVMHAADAPKSTPGMEIRALRYGRGIGWALAKNPLPVSIRLRFFVRPAGGALLALLRGDLATARYHRYAFRGRWEGWRKYHAAGR